MENLTSTKCREIAEQAEAAVRNGNKGEAWRAKEAAYWAKELARSPADLKEAKFAEIAAHWATKVAQW